MLSSPRGTEMFQFPRFPLPALCVQTGVTPHDGRRVSPFGYPRIKAWSAAPRGFSQPPTSFIGFRRQGIHRWLFVAWKNKDARARYGVLKERVRRSHNATVQGGGEEDAPPFDGGVTPSKRNRGAWLEPSTNAEATSPATSWTRTSAKASDQLGVPLTGRERQ